MIDVTTFPPEYTKWLNGQTGVDRRKTFLFSRGRKAFECVYSPFIRLDPL